MPVVRKQSATAPQILRPLLEVSRHSIEDYARQNELCWIYDESNDDTAFHRNFLRHDILPLLKKRYPNYPHTLLRASRHFAEASQLLDELAAMDCENCLVRGKLQIERIRKLNIKRVKNLLRYTLAQQGAMLPSTAKLEDIANQLLSANRDNQIHITFGNHEIRCFKGTVYILPKNKKTQAQSFDQCVWQGEARLVLPHLNGAIRFTEVVNQGIDQQKLRAAPVTVRIRAGGERFTPACNRPRRSLKNLLQETSIPPWQRSMPLLFCGEHLVWVPGIGIDCKFQVKSGETGILPLWEAE
jgi:tRNA(Ile)-lysidine synthase